MSSRNCQICWLLFIIIYYAHSCKIFFAKTHIQIVTQVEMRSEWIFFSRIINVTMNQLGWFVQKTWFTVADFLYIYIEKSCFKSYLLSTPIISMCFTFGCSRQRLSHSEIKFETRKRFLITKTWKFIQNKHNLYCYNSHC